MTRSRWRAALLLVGLLIGAAAIAIGWSGRSAKAPPTQATDRPTLLLLTSLPLMFGEQFSLESGGSDALTELERHYRVLPISVTDPAELGRGRLLLLAHPPAQTPEDLVSLDEWVRQGGRVLLLADPLLEWPSERPLGDTLRPPPMFADTGLLARWGIRLDMPAERGPKMGSLGGRDVLTASPGTLHGQCEISAERLVARCSIGKGVATIVADADFLGVQHIDGPTQNNLPALIEELRRLSSR
jgi:hypothetical protein